MGCGNKCLKVILMTVNIIFFLTGLAIAAVGIWIRVDKDFIARASEQLDKLKVDDLNLGAFEEDLYIAAYILIAFGAFTLIVGFCGCCGAMKESKCLLGTYIALVAIILGAEIAGGVYAYVNRNEIKTELGKVASGVIMDKYGKDNATTASWNLVFAHLKCCGGNNVKDFNQTALPPSCCVKSQTIKNLTRCQAEEKGYFHEDGCVDKIYKLIEDRPAIILGVAAGIAGFQLLVLLAAICFCCNMDKDD